MAKSKKIQVNGKEITIILDNQQEYISLTDMLKTKDGDFFISDWLRNRNVSPIHAVGDYKFLLCLAAHT